MKVGNSAVLLLSVLTLAFAYPASKDDENGPKTLTDVDFVPLEDQRPGARFPPDGVVDVDANAGGFFENPFAENPLPSLFDSFNVMMTRLRQQLNQFLGRLPNSPDNSPYPELHIPNVGDIDLGKGNTTSVTKIINGHKVTINETEYKQDHENGGSFFKVRIVDVHPDSAEASTDKVTVSEAPSKDRESMEEQDVVNEISKINDNEALKPIPIETFDEVDTPATHDASRRNIHWDYTKPIESIEDNNLNSELIPPPDLTNDIYVNQLMLDAGAPTNPDAEVFDVFSGLPPQLPKKTAALNYMPPQRQYDGPNSDFDRAGIRPTFDNNIPFIPQQMFPPYMMPNYMGPHPNFPGFPSHFPPNQMYLSRQYLPVGQSFPVGQHSQRHVSPYSEAQKSSIVAEKGTTHESLSTNYVPENTPTDANSPST